MQNMPFINTIEHIQYIYKKYASQIHLKDSSMHKKIMSVFMLKL